MIKEGGRVNVPTGKNARLDNVSNGILKLLKDNDIHIAVLVNYEEDSTKYHILLCDEDNREVAALTINEDDRLIRELW